MISYLRNNTTRVELTVIVPTAHAESNVEKGPLPEGGSEIILLVGVWYERVVGSHHGDVEVDEILPERRLVVSRLTGWELLVDMALDVPVGVDVTRVVLLDASSLDLLEAPLRKVDIASSEIAAEILVLQSECSCECSKFRVISRSGITDDFNNPVILGIAHSDVAVARNLPVRLGDGGGDRVRVQVTASLSVNETDDIAVARVAQLFLGIVWDLVAVGVEEPVVVGILVVVASDLLLSRAFGVRLDVRVKQTSSVTHVLQRGARAVCDLKRTVLADFGATQIGLEERTHLGVARTAVLKNQEVEVEGECVDSERNEDKTEYAESEVRGEFHLFSLALELSSLQCGRTLGILRLPNLFQRSSIVYRPTRAVTKKPTHLTLHTHPIETPVSINHRPHSGEKGSCC